MRAADPAARTTFAFVHLVFHDTEVLFAGFGFSTRYRPADPLVAGQRRDIIPHLMHLLICQDRLTHISW